jgi:hypothetical protein
LPSNPVVFAFSASAADFDVASGADVEGVELVEVDGRVERDERVVAGAGL